MFVDAHRRCEAARAGAVEAATRPAEAAHESNPELGEIVREGGLAGYLRLAKDLTPERPSFGT